MMDSYLPSDRTADAKAIAAQFSASGPPAEPAGSQASPFQDQPRRIPSAPTFALGGGKVAARGKGKFQYGELDVDLACVEQLVEESQTRAIADAVAVLSQGHMSEGLALPALLDLLEAKFDTQGLDTLAPQRFNGNYARPRRFEVAAALNRFRGGGFQLDRSLAAGAAGGALPQPPLSKAAKMPRVEPPGAAGY